MRISYKAWVQCIGTSYSLDSKHHNELNIFSLLCQSKFFHWLINSVPLSKILSPIVNHTWWPASAGCQAYPNLTDCLYFIYKSAIPTNFTFNLKDQSDLCIPLKMVTKNLMWNWQLYTDYVIFHSNSMLFNMQAQREEIMTLLTHSRIYYIFEILSKYICLNQ